MPESFAQLGDCLKFLKDIPTGFFDLAVVDPPTGKGNTAGVGKYGRLREVGNGKSWDNKPPTKAYFKELMRVSKAQVIWCGIFYPLRPSSGWLVWDKGEGFYNKTFAECELAWTSFERPVKKFRYDPLANGDYKNKIHPTQKPVALYDWTFTVCGCKPGDKILDTHLGSGSSRIAAWHAEIDFYGYEADPQHFIDQEARFNIARREQKLFAVPAAVQPIQLTIS